MNTANEFGIRAPVGVHVEEEKHPSRGGNAYSQEMREMVISMYISGGLQVFKSSAIRRLQLRNKFPHKDTIKRWVDQYNEVGHCLPKKATGNHRSQREIKGIDLFHLALFRRFFPKAYIDEVIAFINNMNPAVPPYSRSQVVRAESRLGLTNKVGSSTSDCAYLPVNLQKRKNYWELSYPDGIHGEHIDNLIDIDECNLKLQSQDRRYGKVTRGKRCNDSGKFKKGAGSSSLLMAIGGRGFSYHKIYTGGGTDLWRFYEFMDGLLEYLAQQYPGVVFTITMDNLNIHKNPIILDLIEQSGHRLVFRAPYWSCDGAIEYVFNTIQSKLQMKYNTIDTVDALVNAINIVVGGMVEFKPYFRHVGGDAWVG